MNDCQAFKGKTTLARHRFVNEILKDQIAQMHAFSQVSITIQAFAVKKTS
jgi:stress-induced morphogen